MNEKAIQIQGTFPELAKDDLVGFIGQIQKVLCPTCMENGEYNPDVKKDCEYRPEYVSPEQIYTGDTSDNAHEHWLGALLDARGAIIMIHEFSNKGKAIQHEVFSDYYLGTFCKACHQAQEYIAQGFSDWNQRDEINDKRGGGYANEIFDVGSAYKFGDENDPVFAEMSRLGRKHLNV